MSEYVVTFDQRPVMGLGALEGLRRMTLADARAVVAAAARIPKSGRIVHVETLEEVGAEPTSGYTNCACRDCMDTTVSSDTSKPELCSLCREAGCEPFPRDDWRKRATSVQSFECQRDDAYGEC